MSPSAVPATQKDISHISKQPENNDPTATQPCHYGKRKRPLPSAPSTALALQNDMPCAAELDQKLRPPRRVRLVTA
jgi:hypothetical protein